MLPYQLKAVSPRKFYIMAIMTMGLYVIYWWYQQWKTIEREEAVNILPLVRAFFSLFFCHDFFKRIHPKPLSTYLTVTYILVCIMTAVLGVIGVISFWLILLQMALTVLGLPGILWWSVDAILGASNGQDVDDSFNAYSYLALFCGVFLWLANLSALSLFPA